LTGPQRFGSSFSRAVRGARRRVADAGWSVVQTPVAAGLAWYIAHTLLGHHQPFFAPTAAAVSLSKNRALRGQRALQLIVGVVLGIGVGSAVKAAAGANPSAPGGSGAVAIGVAAAIALLAALALGGGFFARGVLFVNQSATSAILMIAVAGPATGPERLVDALIGGGVTLVITVILFPAAPLPLIQDAVQQVFGALRDTLARLAEIAGPGHPAAGMGPRRGRTHTAPAGRAPTGPVDRPPGREPRAAPLARTVPGPAGRGTDRFAPAARGYCLEPGARQHRRGRSASTRPA
jgi:uncharacterized membrane protein YccC